MTQKVNIKHKEHLTHDVLRLVTDRPSNYSFEPGQATEVAINKPGWENKKRPFTFTGLPGDVELEFTIKMYPGHDGVTKEMDGLRVGDSLLIGDAWGAISYQGPGTFIAGGAGITPFIAIVKDLRGKKQLDGHRLIFANKTEKDIILKKNLETWLDGKVSHILSEENHQNYHHGKVDQDFLTSQGLDTEQKVYLCGPPPMMEALEADLYAMGISKEQLVAEHLTS
ncbi:flavodoxin reductase [Maribacter sp. 2307ULW6-5]|uniref:flavodoxin reductase n=1 Tax=Maribacter sp. 2307ULW6-5 TaxID=3386275 RepID=UPI0039BD2D06